MNRCKWHKEENLGFVATAADAEKRMENGEAQIQCGICELWFWPHLFGHPDSTDQNASPSLTVPTQSGLTE